MIGSFIEKFDPKAIAFPILLAIAFPIAFPITPAFARSTCPEAIKSISALLVRDLPSYGNRAIIRGRSRSDMAELTQVVVASQPELEPIAVASLKPDPNLYQVFLTTLERQVSAQKIYEFQQFHWIFLVKTQAGWRLVKSFSRTSRYPKGDWMTEIQDSSQGAIAQGIKTWLRDCAAGSIQQ